VSGKNGTKDIQEELEQGFMILDRFMKENRNLPTQELFRQCWKLILRNEHLFIGAVMRAHRFNRFKIDGKNLVYTRFAIFYKFLRKEFEPPVELAGEGPDLQAHPGSIFVSFHSGLELAIAKVLQNNFHDVAMITAGPRRPQLLDLFALSPVPVFISRSVDCLVLARDALIKSSSVIIDVDYTVFDEEQQRLVHKIGIATFAFAKKMARPLYFVKVEVNADAEIVCTARLAQTEAPANEIAGNFMSFVRDTALPGNDYSIGDWFSDFKGELNARTTRSS
jgi:hypothetical protein